MNNNESQHRQRQYLAEFIIRHEASLRHYAMQLTHNATDAQDLYQETIFRSLSNSQRYSERNSAGAWLFTIMHNTYINEVKSRQRHGGRFHDIEGVEVIDDSDDIAEWKFARERLITAMQQLAERDRLIIELRMTGVSYREISIQLDMNEGTVKSAINRIKKRLYFLMKELW